MLPACMTILFCAHVCLLTQRAPELILERSSVGGAHERGLQRRQQRGHRLLLGNGLDAGEVLLEGLPIAVLLPTAALLPASEWRRACVSTCTGYISIGAS
jgi:hypothetical protein